MAHSSIIYAIRNRVSGKTYIGQSCQGLAARKAEHIWRANSGDRDHKLYLAMRKHGVDAFEFSVICHALQPEHLDGLEREVIASFNSYHRGYNMTEGGNGVSTETRAKLSKIFKGRKAPWSRKILASVRARGLTGGFEALGAYTNKGSAHPHARAFIVREPSGDQNHVIGLKSYCRANGLTHKAMLDTLAGKQTHHKGFALIAKLPNHFEQASRRAA